MNVLCALRAAASGVVFAAVLPASLITTIPSGGTTTTFPGGTFATGCFSGPNSGTVAGFPITASGDACYNYDETWGFVGNGSWDGLGLIGDNSSATLLTLDLGGLYSSVGGFMNYAPGFGTPTITAIAADGVTVLETYDLSVFAPIDTPGGSNAGAFRGIDRATADIRFFQIGGSFIAMNDITLSSVPEPSTLALTGLAMAALGLIRRRRR